MTTCTHKVNLGPYFAFDKNPEIAWCTELVIVSHTSLFLFASTYFSACALEPLSQATDALTFWSLHACAVSLLAFQVLS